MRLRLGLRTVLVPVLVLATTLAGGWWASGRDTDTRSSLTAALDALPASTQAASFTDWTAVRDDLGLGDSGSAATRAALTDDAALRDLSTRSVLGGLIDDMRTAYGWSAADLEWESYGQAADGTALVAKVRRSVSFDAIRDRLQQIGYTRDGDTWVISDATRRAVGQDLAAALPAVTLLPRDHLVVSTGDTAYAGTVVRTIRGRGPSLLTVRPAYDAVVALAGSDTVLLESARQTCPATSLGQLDADVLAQAAAAVRRAGPLAEPVFAGRGMTDGRTRQSIRFVFTFKSPVVAAQQSRTRAALATGPFIGRTGRVEDSLDLVSSSVTGSAATLRFDLDPDTGSYMSGEGPLLFASCPA